MTTSEFQTHSIFKKIEQLLNRIDEKEVREKLEVDKIDFFRTACQFLIDRLKVTIPTLIPISELNAVSTEFENALIQINNFIGNKNAGHITNAVNNINSALVYIKNLPIPYSKGDLDFSKIVSQFQKTVEDKLIQTENQKIEIESKIENLKNDLEAKQTELNQLTTKISNKEKELETISSNFQTQFDTANANFTKLVSDDRTEFRKEIDADRKQIKDDTDGIIKDLERKLNDANKLVNVIGNVGVTGNYQIIANEHKITADNWRKIAIMFMCILSGLLIFSIWKIGDIDYDWHKAIIRIIASAILIYPATYASKESGKHRKLENLNRKLELELSSISPFIEILDEAKKQEIKAKLVEKYFGNNYIVTEDNVSNDNISVNMLETIVKLVTGIMKK
ncbi:hypothetical protein SAMN06298216_0775 [Spirosomataceae bacterium TFI 002]|nr:hypothetical protein SAMN06298216_0775 [Spirosomataceae bacterium TFI 002]